MEMNAVRQRIQPGRTSPVVSACQQCQRQETVYPGIIFAEMVTLGSDSDAAAPRHIQTDNDTSGGPCGA